MPRDIASPPDGESLWQCLWRTKAYRLLALLLCYMVRERERGIVACQAVAVQAPYTATHLWQAGRCLAAPISLP